MFSRVRHHHHHAHSRQQTCRQATVICHAHSGNHMREFCFFPLTLVLGTTLPVTLGGWLDSRMIVLVPVPKRRQFFGKWSPGCGLAGPKAERSVGWDGGRTLVLGSCNWPVGRDARWRSYCLARKPRAPPRGGLRDIMHELLEESLWLS